MKMYIILNFVQDDNNVKLLKSVPFSIAFDE